MGGGLLKQQVVKAEIVHVSFAGDDSEAIHSRSQAFRPAVVPLHEDL